MGSSFSLHGPNNGLIFPKKKLSPERPLASCWFPLNEATRTRQKRDHRTSVLRPGLQTGQLMGRHADGISRTSKALATCAPPHLGFPEQPQQAAGLSLPPFSGTGASPSASGCCPSSLLLQRTGLRATLERLSRPRAPVAPSSARHARRALERPLRCPCPEPVKQPCKWYLKPVRADTDNLV